MSIQSDKLRALCRQRHNLAVRYPSPDEAVILDLVEVCEEVCLYEKPGHIRKVLDNISRQADYWTRRGDGCYVAHGIALLLRGAVEPCLFETSPHKIRQMEDIRVDVAWNLYLAATDALNMELGRLDGATLSTRLNDAAAVVSPDGVKERWLADWDSDYQGN